MTKKKKKREKEKRKKERLRPENVRPTSGLGSTSCLYLSPFPIPTGKTANLHQLVEVIQPPFS